MRNWIGRLLLASLAYCIPILITAANAACDRPIAWAWNQFPPYAYLSPTGDLKGLDVEIVERVLEEMGCTGTPVEMPAKRALAELERGEIDLVAAASITPEREVANLGGDDFAAYEKATSEAMLVSRNPSIEDRFRLVEGARVDGLIEDDIAGADMARRLGLESKLATAPVILGEAPVCLLTSKTSITPEQVAEMNEAIDMLQKSGELDRIVANYRLPTN